MPARAFRLQFGEHLRPRVVAVIHGETKNAREGIETHSGYSVFNVRPFV